MNVRAAAEAPGGRCYLAFARIAASLAIVASTAMLPTIAAAQQVIAPALQAAAPEIDPAARELVVGTKQAPPFAMKDDQGHWSGVSIELWRQIADRLKLRYRLVDVVSVDSLLENLKSGDFDVAVAAITITPERQQSIDFSTPYYHTGTGIAVQSDRITSWGPVIRSIASFSFLQAAMALLGLAFLAGALIWLFEHRANESFGGGMARGISSGVWWSTNTMTQRASGGAAPATLPGRIVAIVWMVVSVIAIAVFTAGITSALTTKRLHGAVNTLADLSAVRVGVVRGTSTEDALSRMRIKFRTVVSPNDGFEALENGTIDALAYDRPILAWMIRQDGSSSVELTDVTFEPQSYAIALRNDSALRKPINVALLEAEESDWWKDILFKYLGQAAN
jgi:polar amino acid transport system substrate-binding protein